MSDDDHLPSNDSDDNTLGVYVSRDIDLMAHALKKVTC